jgi:membrane associated rhomboid family serine protease
MRNLPVAVRNIIIVNVVMMLATYLRQSLMIENFALFFPTSPYFKIWQPITYLFMHGDFVHLLFNMYTLVIFGTVLERVWGPKKFLLFYFVTGIGAALVHMGVLWVEYTNAIGALGMTSADAAFKAMELAENGHAMAPIGFDAVQQVLFVPTVGASGAIYGILMGYAMLYPDSIMRLLFPPVSLKAKWFVLIFAGIELLLGMSSSGTGIAHFAHLGGLIFGFLLLVYWKKNHKLYGNY